MRRFLLTSLLLTLLTALAAAQQTDLAAEPAKALEETQAFFDLLTKDDLSGAQKLQPDVSQESLEDWKAAAKERIALLQRLIGLEKSKKTIAALGEEADLQKQRKDLQAQLQQLRDEEPKPAPTQVSTKVVAGLKSDLQTEQATRDALTQEHRQLTDLEQRVRKGIENAPKEDADAVKERSKLTEEESTPLVRYKLATVGAKLTATEFWTAVLPGVPQRIQRELDVVDVEQKLQEIRVNRAQDRFGAAQERLSAQQKQEAERKKDAAEDLRERARAEKDPIRRYELERLAQIEEWKAKFAEDNARAGTLSRERSDVDSLKTRTKSRKELLERQFQRRGIFSAKVGKKLLRRRDRIERNVDDNRRRLAQVRDRIDE
ncbi:MAG: hypothetical protein O7C98_11580, partial [Planctomycetota bacterium]|nr:hypothetical protein [Planctomycetota bacterium]